MHRSGDESIGGLKTLQDSIYLRGKDKRIVFMDHTFNKGSSTDDVWTGIKTVDANEQQLALMLMYVTNAAPTISFMVNKAYSQSDTAELSLRFGYYTNDANNGWFGPRFDNNNLINLGQAGGRWTQLYAVSSTINTSDERLKSSIAPFSDNVLDAWGNIDFVQFQFNDAIKEKGQNARIHSGLIAQRVDSAFESKGLDASRYALFCHDSWEASPEKRDQQGNIIEEAREAGDEYSLRYEEALCMEAAYQRRENSRLKSRISDLEERLASLENKLKQ